MKHRLLRRVVALLIYLWILLTHSFLPPDIAMAAPSITFSQFQQDYSKTHPLEKNRNKTVFSLWGGLKEKHGLTTRKYVKREINVKDYPLEFHQDALDLINEWKLAKEDADIEQKRKDQDAKRSFFSMFRGKKGKVNKVNNKRSRSSPPTINNRNKRDISNSNENISNDNNSNDIEILIQPRAAKIRKVNGSSDISSIQPLSSSHSSSISSVNVEAELKDYPFLFEISKLPQYITFYERFGGSSLSLYDTYSKSMEYADVLKFVESYNYTQFIGDGLYQLVPKLKKTQILPKHEEKKRKRKKKQKK